MRIDPALAALIADPAPMFGFDEGLVRTIAWYREHLNGR